MHEGRGCVTSLMHTRAPVLRNVARRVRAAGRMDRGSSCGWPRSQAWPSQRRALAWMAVGQLAHPLRRVAVAASAVYVGCAAASVPCSRASTSSGSALWDLSLGDRHRPHGRHDCRALLRAAVRPVRAAALRLTGWRSCLPRRRLRASAVVAQIAAGMPSCPGPHRPRPRGDAVWR